jgi:hypothetical protein
MKHAAPKIPDESPFQLPASDSTAPLRWWDRVERALVRSSEWLNPILVKEARQALKSRQFMVTFGLLLLFGWAWSLLGVALLSPGVYFAPGGRTMLTGYIFILLVPMLVVVPFSAFRSLAAEREDGTFELLSVTTLSARQIVTGKLGSAMLQMVVYYSALAPCIAFTYLLRGIDILTISLLLYYAFLISTLLSALGLLVATISKTRHWQVLLSVSLVIALVAADIIASWFGAMVIWATGSAEYDNLYFWIVQLAVVMFCLSYLVLFVLGAAAQISFASDNRSTKLRVVLLGQQLLWVFWMVYLWLETREEEVLFVIMPFAAIHWYAAGALMSGESAKLSPRVRRSLPHSFLGRMFGTWFNPGAGTGYVFCVVNLWSLALLTGGAAVAGELFGMGGRYLMDTISVATLAAAYVTVYLGVGRLLILVIRPFLFTGLLLPLLIHVVMAALGAFVPAVVGGWMQGFNNLSYTELQLTNWAWTLIDAAEGDLWATPFVPLTLYTSAGGLFLLHLLLARREVEQTRLQTPDRVVEDERQLHPEKAPPPRRRSSPWEEVTT